MAGETPGSPTRVCLRARVAPPGPPRPLLHVLPGTMKCHVSIKMIEY